MLVFGRVQKQMTDYRMRVEFAGCFLKNTSIESKSTKSFNTILTKFNSEIYAAWNRAMPA
jgi:hypothetical protein